MFLWNPLESSKNQYNRVNMVNFGYEAEFLQKDKTEKEDF